MLSIIFPKGTHDGICATIKHELDRLIFQDRIRIRNTYEVYLAASRNLSQIGRTADVAVQRGLEFSRHIIIDRDFRCFYPCEIFLYPRTAARWPHVDP